MAVKHRHPRLRHERAIQNAVQISSVHRDIAVQISITVVRQDDFAQNPRIAVEPVPPPPQRQASLLLASPVLETAKQVLRELTMEHFSQNNSMLQRMLQILRMWLFR